MAEENNIPSELVIKMAKAGVFFGHKKSKTHPRMKPFVSGARNEIEFIDPDATISSLNRAIEFLKDKVKNGGSVLLVETLASGKSAVESFAKEFKFPFVISRWLGGTITNFKIISDRLKYYEDLEVKKEKGELSKYTKKEQRQFDKEIGKLSKFFIGLKTLMRLPDVVFIIDIKTHSTALKEAKILKIPVVAILDSDDDPKLVDYPIFASDHNCQGIQLIMNEIKEGIKV